MAGGSGWLAGAARPLMMRTMRSLLTAMFTARRTLEIIERRQRGFHRHVAGLQLVAGDHQVLIGRVVLNDRNCAAARRRRQYPLRLFQPQQSDRGILSHFELYVIQPRHAGFKVVRVLRKISSWPSFHLSSNARAADRMLAEVGTPFLHLLTGNHRGKVQRQHMQEGGVGSFRVILPYDRRRPRIPLRVVLLPLASSSSACDGI